MKVALVLLLCAGAAHADGRAAVYPIAAPTELADVASTVTATIAQRIGGELAQIPIEDAAALLDCDVESSRCLDAVARAAHAHRLVFGTLAAGTEAGTLAITLTRFDVGPAREQRTFTIPRAHAERAIVADLAPMFGLVEPVVVAPAPAAAAPEPEPEPTIVIADAPPKSPTHHRAIAAWVLFGGGLATVAAGGAALWSAHGIDDAIATAPTETPADFAHLTSLEDRAASRTRLGYALVGVGGAVSLAGVIAAVVMHDRAPSQLDGISLAPTRSGGSLVYTGSWR